MWIPLSGLTPPHARACPLSGSGIPTLYVMVFFEISELSREVIFRFVNIGGIVDHHCLIRFIIIRSSNTKYGRPVVFVMVIIFIFFLQLVKKVGHTSH